VCDVRLAYVGQPTNKFRRGMAALCEQNGTSGPLVISGWVGDVRARCLIDSGASGNFVNKKFLARATAEGNKVGVTSLAADESFTVLMGDGSRAKCQSVARALPLSLGEGSGIFECTLDGNVLQLMDQYDVILGTPWLEQHNPDIDWRERRVGIKQGRHTVVLRPAEPPLPKDEPDERIQDLRRQVLTALQVKRALRQGEKVYLALVRTVEDPKTGEVTLNVFDVDTAAEGMSPPAAEFVRANADLFAEPDGLPPLRDINHEVNLEPGHPPPCKPTYRMPADELEELRRQLKVLLEKKHIQPSHSPYGAPVLFVKKKDGSMRLCVDYRALNKITIKNSYPLPRIDEILDRLHGAKVFSQLDMRDAFHQIRVEPGHVPRTAFRTRYGLFEFTVMPFGLTSAPGTMQALLNKIFVDHQDEFVVIYLDDILVFSKNEADHKRHLDIVAQLLRKHQLLLKLKKCNFFQTSVEFLGHTVSGKGVSADKTKVEAVKEWPRPSDVGQLRSFLGIASYYRRFVQGFAHTAAPLNELLKKDVTWQWQGEHERAYAGLKAALVTAPVLAVFDFTRDCVLSTDASAFAIGAVISQEQDDGTLRPVAYESRKLKAAEVNYPVHEKELLAIVHALKVWRCYCKGRRTLVATDHAPLRYLLTQKTLSQRQARWQAQLAEYDLEIRHIPGKQNVVADALSRRSDLQPSVSMSVIMVGQTPADLGKVRKLVAETVLEAGVISHLTVDMDILERIIDAYGKDTNLTTLREKEPEKFDEGADGAWYHTVEGQRRLCVPHDVDIIQMILEEHHDTVLGGHLGSTKTLNSVRRYFFWQGMEASVRDFVRSCQSCQQNKSSSKHPMGLLHPLPVPEERWESVSLDFMMGLEKTAAGFDGIVVFVDRLSKMFHAFPIHSSITGEQTARLMIRHIFAYYGMPLSIVSDRDPRFTGEFWQRFWQGMGTRLRMSTADHPQTDGQTERANRTIKQMLRAFVNDRRDDWDELLPVLEFAYNDTVQASTGHTPFFLNIGAHPRRPTVSLARGADKVPAVLDLLGNMRTALENAKQNIRKAQVRQKAGADARRSDARFAVGERVWLDATQLSVPTASGAGQKLRPQYEGPFVITKVPSDVTVELKLPHSFRRKHPVFHVSKLKKHISGEDGHFRNRAPPAPPPALDVEEDLWEIDKFLKKAWRKHRVEVLVRWKGNNRSEDRWVPVRPGWLNEVALEEAEAMPLENPEAAERFRSQNAERRSGAASPAVEQPPGQEATQPSTLRRSARTANNRGQSAAQ
jgi:hypothetical protein